jgi:dipeptidyl aminopeptidase/acylaminoacyl peptidase
LTSNQDFNFHPSWSPGGRQILFASDRDANELLFDVFVMNADGTAPTNLTQNPGSTDGGPSWSPDGNQILQPQWRSLPRLSDEHRRKRTKGDLRGNTCIELELVTIAHDDDRRANLIVGSHKGPSALRAVLVPRRWTPCAAPAKDYLRHFTAFLPFHLNTL